MLSRLAVPFGYVMYLCYRLLKSYGLAIVLFTLLTKIILFPVAVWTHKNSIKLVKLQPQINRIKVKFFGDPDSIADEQAKIYKSVGYNPFASLVPLFIQIILLMGLINVIYNPLTHILRIDYDTTARLVSEEYRITGGEERASIQLDVISDIQSGKNIQGFSEAAASEVLNDIQNLKLDLIHIKLSDIPATSRKWSLLVPIIAGLSALLLCFVQNRLNPLQAEQGFYGKLGTTAVSVGISLILGGFVPVGIGFYWILSNIFTIIQQFILNLIYNPKKHIDYKELEESKQELNALEKLGEKKRLFANNENAKREKADYKRFFSIANKHLVFYSEKSGFYKYFEGVINYLLEHSNIRIHYITSDPDDKIFELAKSNDKIRPYYIGEKKLITLMMKMDADMVVMTMPDLDNFHIKRSYVKKDVEYVYMYHGITNSHMVARKGCFDNYDTIMCVGPHQVEEIRETEAMYGLKEKRLIECGYDLIERKVSEYESREHAVHDKKIILIAPSWQEDNILDYCLDDVVKNIVSDEYNVIIRPHPEYIKRFNHKVEQIFEKYRDIIGKGLEIETDFSSDVFEADLLITDWSTVAYEYSFVTKKPTLFIDTPMKVLNKEYVKYKLKPVDITWRNMAGKSISPENLENIGKAVRELLDGSEEYSKKIGEMRNTCLFNFGSSSKVAGKYIIDSLLRRMENKKP